MSPPSASESTLNSPGTSNCIASPALDAGHDTQTDSLSDIVDEYSFEEDATSTIKSFPARLDDSGFMDVSSQMASSSFVSSYKMKSLLEDQIDE